MQGFMGEGERKDLVKAQMFLALVVVLVTNREHRTRVGLGER